METFIKLFLPIIAFIISLISIILSLINFWRELMHLKIDVKDISSFVEETNQFLMIDLIINNNSKNNIVINYVSIMLNNSAYTNAPNKITLGNTGIKLGKEVIEWKKTTLETPIKLNSYDNVSDTLLFVFPNNIVLPQKVKLVFFTSRGKKQIVINRKVQN